MIPRSSPIVTAWVRVVRSQLLEDAGYVLLHRILCNRKLGGDFLVCVPLRDQLQNLQFARGQLVLGGMHGQLRRDLGRNPLASRMHGADGLQQILMHVPFSR